MLETREEIEQWLVHHNVSNYEIRDDLTVDVNTGVYLNYVEDAIDDYSNTTGAKIQEIYACEYPDVGRIGDFGDGHPLIYEFKPIVSLPIRFGRVMGDFIIRHNELSSLEGCPTYVHGEFDCAYNNLKTLSGGPLEVLEHFSCENNSLKNLFGAPRRIGADFYCFANPLEELGVIETHMRANSTFISSPIKEFGYSKICIDGDDFNDKVQELKRIREEKALFESSIAKVMDTPPLGLITPHAVEPQQQPRAKPKFKL